MAMEEMKMTDNEGNVRVYVSEQRRSNGLGIAGFVLSLLALLLCWVPFVNWVLLFLGFLFSILGMIREPRAMAITGLVLSIITVFINFVFFIFMASLFG